VARRLVLNASPLIVLGKLGKRELIGLLASEWVLPQAVAAEVARP
jgi:hypothetical protein